MKLIVDASVAVKWAIEEDGRDAARRLVSDEYELLAPDFALVEIGNILWKKVRRRELDHSQALKAGDEIGPTYDRLIPTAELTAQALGLALALDHPVYDCLYLAAAEHEEAALVTADKNLKNKVGNTRHAERVLLLGQTP